MWLYTSGSRVGLLLLFIFTTGQEAVWNSSERQGPWTGVSSVQRTHESFDGDGTARDKTKSILTLAGRRVDGGERREMGERGETGASLHPSESFVEDLELDWIPGSTPTLQGLSTPSSPQAGLTVAGHADREVPLFPEEEPDNRRDTSGTPQSVDHVTTGYDPAGMNTHTDTHTDTHSSPTEHDPAGMNTHTDTHTDTHSSPTDQHTHSPTDSPTDSPTHSHTDSPTHSHTHSHTHSPTDSPTDSPTHSPTDSPTDQHTHSPTDSPTHSPTDSPTDQHTHSPTHSPTDSPTVIHTSHRDPSISLPRALRLPLSLTSSPLAGPGEPGRTLTPQRYTLAGLTERGRSPPGGRSTRSIREWRGRERGPGMTPDPEGLKVTSGVTLSQTSVPGTEGLPGSDITSRTPASSSLDPDRSNRRQTTRTEINSGTVDSSFSLDADITNGSESLFSLETDITNGSLSPSNTLTSQITLSAHILTHATHTPPNTLPDSPLSSSSSSSSFSSSPLSPDRDRDYNWTTNPFIAYPFTTVELPLGDVVQTAASPLTPDRPLPVTTTTSTTTDSESQWPETDPDTPLALAHTRATHTLQTHTPLFDVPPTHTPRSQTPVPSSTVVSPTLNPIQEHTTTNAGPVVLSDISVLTPNATALIAPSGPTATTLIAPSGPNTTTLIAPSGPTATALIAPSGPNTTALIAPSGPNTTSLIAPSGPNTTSLIAPSGPNTTTLIAPSGPNTTTLIAPSGPNTTSLITPSGLNTTSLIAPSGPNTTPLYPAVTTSPVVTTTTQPSLTTKQPSTTTTQPMFSTQSSPRLRTIRPPPWSAPQPSQGSPSAGTSSGLSPSPPHSTLSSTHRSRVYILPDRPAAIKEESIELLLQVIVEESSSDLNTSLEEDTTTWVAPYLQRAPGFQDLQGVWSSGRAVQSVVVFRTSGAVAWLGVSGADSLLERTGLAQAVREGRSFRGSKVTNITVGGVQEDVCLWLFKCTAGFECVSRPGDMAICSSVCHSDYCHNHGICTHHPHQPPLCQCPVGDHFWFMGRRCDVRMTQQRLVGACLGVLVAIVTLIGAVAWLAVRRYRAMLIKTKVDQTRSSYRRFNHFDELSGRFRGRSIGGSADSLDNPAFTRSDELLHMRALDRTCCYHDDTLSLASTCPSNGTHLNTVYPHNSQYGWAVSEVSLAECALDSGKASDLSVCSWPIEPIQWTPFPLLQQLSSTHRTTTVRALRPRSYCEGMELVELEKSWTA